MGESWERMVQSIKKALRITLKKRTPYLEMSYKVLLEAE